MALSDEDREHAKALGASITLSEAQLDLLEEVAASAPRQRRSTRRDLHDRNSDARRAS